MIEPDEAELLGMPEEGVSLDVNGTSLTPIVVELPARSFGRTGRAEGKLQIRDELGNERFVPMNLLGPRS